MVVSKVCRVIGAARIIYCVVVFLSVLAVEAHAYDGDDSRKTMTDALYAAYQDYAYIKLCHDGQHFWSTLISDDDLQKAKEKIVVIETEALALLNDAWNKEQNVDT